MYPMKDGMVYLLPAHKMEDPVAVEKAVAVSINTIMEFCVELGITIRRLDNGDFVAVYKGSPSSVTYDAPLDAFIYGWAFHSKIF